ncbi:MAG: SpvB/TcaC N-terminal domain-containing protein, partial [Bacteroidota bacterium]
GGGSIQNIGEKFQANPVTGTGSFSIPVAMSPGRNGFTPQLALNYDSGSGNGPFGMGWNIALPAVMRKTQKCLPQYRDAEDSDIFLLSDAEDLVPALEFQGNEWQRMERQEGDYRVVRYRPRTEGLFARIEKWTEQATGIAHWQVTTKDNITSVYGQSENSRIAYPDEPAKTFKWCIEYTYDEKGNISWYQYKQENSENIIPSLSEKNRLQNGESFNRKYIKSIYYTPDIPFDPANPDYFSQANWHFQLVFDYGEHDLAHPTVDEINPWSVRQDTFSGYRAGFEIRTYRLCRRMLMFHYFEPDLGVAPYLVKSTDMDYNENPVATQVNSITHRCYQDGEPSEAYPPVTFTYSQAVIDPDIHQYEIEDTENLPSGAADSRYRWVDLWGEGLPGILLEDANAWYFKHNLGDENYYRDLPPQQIPVPEARLGAMQTVAERPSIANLNRGGQQLSDIEGDGLPELVIRTDAVSGYYEMNTDRQWQRFRPFEAMPQINWQDPNLRFIDLNGDGLADVLITEDHCFSCYPSKGKEGYGEAYKTLQRFDEEQGPEVIFADAKQSVYLADMSGDGLPDIVRIRNGSVCYWPNMGYARFGAKVGMDNAPQFDHDDIFNQERIRLGDIDGSGTTDILYISNQDVRYYPNQSGNRLGEAVIINQELPTHNLAQLTTLDLLGTGTQCLVWSSPVVADHPPALKFIDLMGGIKPYLITEMNNNMGSITRLKYAPSTKFYLRDEREGNPWITKLPFPVQVVERVEVWDEVDHHRFVSRYAYHHGYFDGTEREFRGFGMVEQWDTETFTDFTEGGLFPPGYNANEEALHVPPVHTKTWFHTGFYKENEKILGQYEQEYWNADPDAFTLNRDLEFETGNAIPTEAEALREAARALRGQLLRQEVYSEDGTPEAQHPYVVTESAYTLRMLQPRAEANRRDRDYGVFFVTPSESISYQYERNPADPRISHQLTLETDAYGHVLQAAAVGYGRRTSQGYAEQDTTLITYAQNTVLNEDNNTDFYRLGVPLESLNYEITGFPDPNSQQTRSGLLQLASDAVEIPFEDLADGSLQKRLLDRSRIYYYDANLDENTSLPFGQIAAHGLPFSTYQLALTPDLLSGVLNDSITRVDTTVLQEGGYENLLADGHYWVPSGRVVFDAAHFYLPVAQDDPFGNRSMIAYDSYYILLNQAEDAIGNITTVQQDYRLLQPDLVTDPNGNRQAFAFDVRGMLTAMAVMGKEGEGDGDTLADPTVIFEYDLFRWMNSQQPNRAYIQSRETHADPGTRWQESYAYSNGMGQVTMTKTKVAPGDAFSLDGNGELLRDGSEHLIEAHADPRWVGNGRTVLDNKGNPVKQYEPYFSSTYEYERETELVEYGVTAVIHYDPLGRAIQTELPDGTLTQVDFDPWQQVNYDQNDTVLESSWYTDRNSPDPAGAEPVDPDERAAWLAAQHANTPQLVRMDALGRPFLTVDDNATDGLYEMHTQLDIKGNPTAITDALGRTSFTYVYNMLNQPIHTTHLDQGARYALSNVLGNPLRAWDSRSHAFRFAYDVLQRPTHSYLIPEYDQGMPGDEQLISLMVYGEQAADPEQQNLRGQPHLIFDGAGLLTNVAFDFKGNLLESHRQLAITYQTTPNWIALDGIGDVATLLAASGLLLEAEQFNSSITYDALNRPESMLYPDNSNVIPGYDEAGLLLNVSAYVRGDVTPVDFVQEISYNARGQRSRILYGNNALTTYDYDAQTFRLNRLLTTRNMGADILQDLNYTYDPVGNITAVQDDTQETLFFNNAQVTPNTRYVYDALYRLVTAHGREHITHNQVPDPTDTGIHAFPDNDMQALRAYTQNYSYDALGNILQLAHLANAGNWTQHYHYDTNNYLLSTSPDGIAPGMPHYTYDAHGNMTAMQHLSAMGWDHADRLQTADLGGGGMAYYTYDAGGDRVRKVIENGAIREERIYLGGWEVYRRYTGGGDPETERESLHIMDNRQRIALVDTLTVENNIVVNNPVSVVRYQLGNHLDSATLELDENAAVISYEEY